MSSSSSSSLSSSSPPPSQPTTPAITTTVTKAPLSSSSTDAPSPLPPASSILHLYAELLVHIRTVSLFASLRTSHTPATTAALSADGQRVTLTHEGHSASIRLPTRIEGGADAALMLPCGPPSKDLTLRLQVKEREGSEGGLLDVRGGGAGGRENVVPWGAGALEGCGRVACKGCGGEVVRVAGEGDGGVKRWMDLPNENWAEMMDFWHCHKPHEHHLPGHRHDERGEKGYAAGNRIVAKSEVGYVDLTYLLLKQEDCRNVQPSPPSPNQQTDHQHLICSSCRTVIGIADSRAEGWRIWKWSIAVTPKQSDEPRKYSIRKWIAAQLLYLIENQGVRKFTVRPDPDVTTDGQNGEEVDPIMIWIFTPDITFSSSVAADARRDPTRAMKVLWKSAPIPASSPALEERSGSNGAVQALASGKTESQALDRESLSVEELRLPEPAFVALKEALRECGEWLPASARVFKEWKVGFLERFEEDEV